MAKNNGPLIFIVEDNTAFNKLIEQQLHQHNFNNVICFTSGEDCLKKLYLNPNIIIQDYTLQGINGLNVLQITKKILPDTEFIFLSAKENIDIAINSVKYGAFDYIVKNNLAFQRLIQKIDNITQIQQLKRKNKRLRIIISLSLIITISLLIVILFLRYHRR